MGEKYLEDAIRFFLEKTALFIRMNLVNIGDFLEQFNIQDANNPELNLNFGKYAIFGFFLLAVAILYLFQIDTIFAPSHISFSFLVIFLSGVFLYFNKA